VGNVSIQRHEKQKQRIKKKKKLTYFHLSSDCHLFSWLEVNATDSPGARWRAPPSAAIAFSEPESALATPVVAPDPRFFPTVAPALSNRFLSAPTRG